MKSKIIILFILVLTNLMVYSQGLFLTFDGNSNAALIDSIRVTNLRTNQQLKLFKNDILVLKDTFNVNVDFAFLTTNSRVFPNPYFENATLLIESVITETIDILISDVTGQTVLQKTYQLEQGKNLYSVSCPKGGIYFITVKKPHEIETTKILQLNAGNQQLNQLVTIDSEFYNYKSRDIDGNSGNEYVMGYRTGDILLFRFNSGIYETVYTTSPVSSMVIEPEFEKCVDADSVSYPVVRIGNQLWMAKNLATTHFNNGDPIPTNIEDSVWTKLRTPAYACYLNNSKYIPNYGLLYNWYAVADPRGACPAGWHVSSDLEWTEMLEYLGGSEIAGGKLKSIGTEFWLTPNEGATNATGFSALPSSGRNVDGKPYNDGRDCYYWLADERDSLYAYNRYIYYAHTRVAKVFHLKLDGFAVRCIKD